MHPVDRAALALIFLLTALCAVLWAANPEPAQVSPLIQRAVEMGYMPCEREDSVGPCYWDATSRGNGEGRSFVVTDDGEVFYEEEEAPWRL